MVLDPKTIVEKAKALGLIRAASQARKRFPLAHYISQHEKIDRACSEIMPLYNQINGGRLSYGIVSGAARKHGVNSQSLRNALSRRRARMGENA